MASAANFKETVVHMNGNLAFSQEIKFYVIVLMP